MNKDISMYLHIPFCKSKCYYCDFLSFDNRKDCIDKYVDALCVEISTYKEKLDKYNIRTIFIGGGTPSILGIKHFTKIFKSLHKYNLDSVLEFTIECNPCSITKEKLKLFKKYGVNRISLGLQAWQDELLKAIGRAHLISDFKKVYNNLIEVGFENINVDVMFSLPGQTLPMLEETIDNLTALNIKHISCYSLTVEENTKIAHLINDGHICIPDEILDREMYYLLCDKLKDRGFEHYEISNFAKPGYESKHNLIYWDAKEYVGLGLGAHSYFEGKRYHNTINLNKYLEEAVAKKFSREDIEVIGNNEQQEEYMFLGLRKLKGISILDFKKNFKTDIENVYGEKIEELINDGLLIKNGEWLKLTKKGIDLSNVVFSNFLK